jgi:uncharacterized protein (UPF0303 family)
MKYAYLVYPIANITIEQKITFESITGAANMYLISRPFTTTPQISDSSVAIGAGEKKVNITTQANHYKFEVQPIRHAGGSVPFVVTINEPYLGIQT